MGGMEFIIPLLLLVVSGLIVWGVVAFLSRSTSLTGSNTQSVTSARGKSPALFDRMSEEGAIAAATRLDEDTHNKVYRYLAVGQLAQAAEIYHRATGVGRIESFVDVQALYQFPQEHGAETPLEDVAGTDPFVPEDENAEEQLTDLTVPSEWFEDIPEAQKQQRFEIQIHRGEDTIAMSSEDVAPWIRDQIEAMIRDDRFDDAAETLTEHTVLEFNEAQDLIKIIAQQIHAADEDGTD